MPVYTVHGPITQGGTRPSADRIAFVRDGFAFWALLLGPFWLMWHRLWLALVGYAIVIIAIALAMSALRVAPGASLVVGLLLALLMGLEAASLRRWTLSRRKWRQLDVVVADNHDGAERRFFDRWRGASRDGPIDPGAPPPKRSFWQRPVEPGPREDIIGLFPQPGGGPR